MPKPEVSRAPSTGVRISPLRALSPLARKNCDWSPKVKARQFDRVLAGPIEAGKQQLAIADLAGFGAVALDNDVKGVAPADAVLEIDDIAHRLYIFGRKTGRDAGGAQRLADAAANLPLDPERR